MRHLLRFPLRFAAAFVISASGFAYANACGVDVSAFALPDMRLENSRKHPGQADYDAGMEYMLGGNGRPKDLDTAADLFLKAANSGMLSAAYALGVINSVHRRTDKSLREAYKWFSRLDDQNYASATFMLSLMTKRGEGTTPDLARAKQLLRKAAGLGNEPAQIYLADELSSGADPSKDELEESACWYELAAKQSAYAKFRLGNFAEQGLLTKPDVNEALRWYCMAREESDKNAAARIRFLTRDSSRDPCQKK